MKLIVAGARGACIVAAAGLLSSCVAPTQVKDVLADKDAYLETHFAPAALPDSVRNTINAADPGPLNFHRMIFGLTWDLNVDDKNKTRTEQQSVTLINGGGSFVEDLTEHSRNGVPISQTYGSSYRGFVILKAQFVNLGAANTGMAFETKKLEQFEPISKLSSGATLDYKYKTGSGPQIMNFSDGGTSCTSGKTYPASQLNSALDGTAEDLDCSYFNANGVLIDKFRYAFLEKYGVAITMHSELATGISDAKVNSVVIE